MRTKMTFITLGALLLLSTSTATAGDGQDESLLQLDLEVLDAGVVYIAHDGSVWEEANGTPGLQSTQVMFRTRVVDPDAPLLLL